MLSIEKIGGTSMLQMEAVLQNIVFYGQTPQLTQRIFVVSAYAGVTDELGTIVRLPGT